MNLGLSESQMKPETFILREISKFMISKLPVTLNGKNTVFNVFLRMEND